ncbi:enoyl-CoA hydratase [Alphaproteobacteria bacterium]|jgi:enoyl-CoA hydratase|nr:enoyl-CoA hydratase [Alphaproteobacteria bacterium]MDA9190937.1 enoyl-CoA hydratase [Alphaproteobacteria bacterium]MDC0461876.1 enoyl-CoA hydratase [Alphaproteobacteria bacterium]
MTDKVLQRRDGAIAHIIFNQPEKRNAVSYEMWKAVNDALTILAEDDTLRVLILSGAGGKSFVAGADISKFESERASKEAVTEYNQMTKKVYDGVANFPKPTIAQIDGFCIGGGVGLAASCDMRYCGSVSQFAIPAARLGLGYEYEGVNRLIHLIGPAFTKEVFFTARRFSAAEMASMGFVNKVVEDNALADYCLEVANMIAANAPLTVAATKFIANQCQLEESEKDLETCAAKVMNCFESSDYIEGRKAFMEKRTPVFKGK